MKNYRVVKEKFVTGKKLDLVDLAVEKSTLEEQKVNGQNFCDSQKYKRFTFVDWRVKGFGEPKSAFDHL